MTETNLPGYVGPVPRITVYQAVDGERAYQNMRKGRDSGAHHHSVEEFMIYMEDYLHEARHVVSRTWGPSARLKTLDVLRKVVALGIACMEENGVVFREGYEAVSSTEPTRTEKALARIAEIIEQVDQRACAADGPVTPTLEEMTVEEMKAIYGLAKACDENWRPS